MSPTKALLRFAYVCAAAGAYTARILEAIYPAEAAGASEYARMFFVEIEILFKRYSK